MSTSGRWQEIKELFHRYQQQAPAGREQWLLQQCRDDAELLRELRELIGTQNNAQGVLDGGAVGLLQRMQADAPAADLTGRTFGAWRLLKLIGEGGMGSVYLAERAQGDFTQRVALKIVRADFFNAELRARFLRERDFLARLNHPHIAQLHDGGVAQDVPYFTLEYVEGEPITRYCDERNLGLRQRVQLMLQVCAAVAYAHRNLIVHRDLKPSNILVSADGTAKLLDFGIAKLLDVDAAEAATATQARLMTPEYAAPEQVLGAQITTATDVYAIGVLLYELLSGRLPYARADAGALSFPQAVVEEAPESIARAPSRTTTRGSNTGESVAALRNTTLPGLRRALRGDLDRIVQRALAKEPEARYASVTDLADDLRAWSEGRAISGGSRRYRLRIFLRRHWLPLGAAAAIVLVLLASGAAIVWQSRQIAREAQNSLQLKDFLFGLFTSVDPNLAKGRTITANELVDRGAARVAADTKLDAQQKAEMQATLGRIYYQLGAYAQADKLQASASETLTSPVLRARAKREHAETVTDIGDLKAAKQLAEEARKELDRMADAPIADRVAAIHAQVRVALAQRDFSAAKTFSDSELALANALAEIDPKALFNPLMDAAAASWGLDQLDDAEAKWREAVQRAARSGDPDDMDLSRARQNLSMALQSKSRYADAAELQQQVLPVYLKVLGDDHPVSLVMKRDLALSNYHLGHYAQARTMLEEVVATQRKKLGSEHPAIAGTLINLGNVLNESDNADAAEGVLREAIAIFEKKYGRDYQGVRMAIGNLAVAHTVQGKLDQASAELLEALALAKKASVADDMDTYRLGEVRRLQGDIAGALELQRTALAGLQKEYGDSHRLTANAHRYLALSLRDSGDVVGAERELRAALSGNPGADPLFVATTEGELGALLLARAETRAEGLKLLGETIELREKFLGADHPLTQRAREALRKAQEPANS